MIPNPTRLTTSRRLVAALSVGALVLTACGGGSSPEDTDGPSISIDDPDGVLEDLDDLPSDLDDGQEQVLEELLDDIDEIENGDDAAPAWNGIRLVDGRSQAVVDTLDADSFDGTSELFSTPIEDSLGTFEFGVRSIDSHVVVGETSWTSGRSAVTGVSLADGTITSTVAIDDVLPGGEFGDITGDADGLFVLATIRGGTDLVAEIDPATGELRSTTDLTSTTTSLLTIASTETHVAVALDSASGVPVSLIERASGEITEIGEYAKLHEVHFVRGELWIVITSSNVNEPSSYEKYALDGSFVGDGTLPRTGILRVVGDRAVVVEPSNRADPAAPVTPIEVEPVGAPIEDFLPDGMVTLTGYAEIDGFAISSGSCCLFDDGGSRRSTAVVDMATGEVVHLADSVRASAILPAA